MERLAVPPASRFGSIARQQPCRQSQSLQILLNPLQTLGRNIDGGQGSELRGELEEVSRLAAGRGTSIENALARLRFEQIRGELGCGVLHRNQSLLESR